MKLEREYAKIELTVGEWSESDGRSKPEVENFMSASDFTRTDG